MTIINAFKDSVIEYKLLFFFNALFLLTVFSAAYFCGASVSEFLKVSSAGLTMGILFIIPAIHLALWFIYQIYKKTQSETKLSLSAAMKAQINEMKSSAEYGRRAANALCGFISISVITTFFCVGKSLIPRLTQYGWDPLFSNIDKILHFGRYPHEIILPMIEAHSLQTPLDYVYILYFPVIFGVVTYALFYERDHNLQKQFIWAYSLCWTLLGLLLAASLASVGPLFYDDFYTGANPYTGLIEALKIHAETDQLKVMILKEELYRMTTDDVVVDINAISAMPSMHMSIVALFVFYLKEKDRFAFLMMAVFWGASLLSIIYLGLHFAVDGYVSLILTGLIWYGLTKRVMSSEQVQQDKSSK